MTPSADLRALVLLHGAVLNGRMWAPIAADLSADFRVEAPDLPGHGARANEPFRLSTAIQAVREVAASLAPARVVLAGDSLGSYVAMAAAGVLTDRLAGAVLAGGTANFQGATWWLYATEMVLTSVLSSEKLRARLTARIPRDYQAGPEILDGGIRPEAFREAAAELRAFDIRPALGRIDAPILFVNGSGDWRHRWGERRALAAARRATVRHVAGVGHGVTLTRPKAVAGMIREFVASL